MAMRDVKDETTETELNTFDALDYPIRLSRLRGKFMASHEICTDSRFATPGGLLQYIDRMYISAVVQRQAVLEVLGMQSQKDT